MKKENIWTILFMIFFVVIIWEGVYLYNHFKGYIGGTGNTQTEQVGTEVVDSDEEESEDVQDTQETQDTQDAQDTQDKQEQETEGASESEESKETETQEPESTPESEVKPDPTPNPQPSNPGEMITLQPNLMIGDSRTVGLSYYSKATDVSYFAFEGMGSRSLLTNPKKLKVDGLGEVTFRELISKVKFERIYIMLGINEIEDTATSILNRHKEAIDLIHSLQPEAKVIIMANIHVSDEFQTKKPVFQNTTLNNINNTLATLANGYDTFYLDGNVLFDDENGNLSTVYTGDGCHLKAVHYPTWYAWIMEQSKEM
ncbi:MAG: hypothetical protein J6R94_03575 [Agathobacter sp.]|nr:hypothetical protein [Agathobacter sp.]